MISFIGFACRLGLPRSLSLALAALLVVTGGELRAEPVASGTWQGTYTCNQGDTGLTLDIAPSAPGAAEGEPLKAVFRFYAIKTNPGVPEGCFSMMGSFVAATGVVALHAGHWLLRPPGYVMVDLAGTMKDGGEVIAGSVYGSNCTNFILRRQAEPDPSPRAACRDSSLVAAIP